MEQGSYSQIALTRKRMLSLIYQFKVDFQSNCLNAIFLSLKRELKQKLRLS